MKDEMFVFEDLNDPKQFFFGPDTRVRVSVGMKHYLGVGRTEGSACEFSEQLLTPYACMWF